VAKKGWPPTVYPSRITMPDTRRRPTQTPRSSHRINGRSHPGVTESQSVQRPVAPRISHATAGWRNSSAAPIAKITIHA
jgi:hypothetical protein